MGIMLQGSVARGDHYLGSDLDLLVLLEDGRARNFRSESMSSILVERHYYDPTALMQKLDERPMLVYGLLDGKILYDPRGALADLVEYAENMLAGYSTPPRTIRDIDYWLFTSRIKLKAAHEAGDVPKAGFLASTTSWKVLEGLWAINDRPMPPSGAVLAHLQDLTRVPDDFDLRVRELFSGGTSQRVGACLTLMDWVLAASASQYG